MGTECVSVNSLVTVTALLVSRAIMIRSVFQHDKPLMPQALSCSLLALQVEPHFVTINVLAMAVGNHAMARIFVGM